MKQNDEVIARLWLRALGSMMGRASRILIDSSTLTVYDVDPQSLSDRMGGADRYMRAPGWTDGKDVYLNAAVLVPKIANLLGGGQHDVATASVKGLIFHENAHILYSPNFRNISAQVRQAGRYSLKAKSTMMAFNILEDQRIERLLIARWPHVRGYMVNLVMQWVMQDGTPSDNAHVLLFGRDYLSKGIRRLARDLFVKSKGKGVALEVEQIIRAYCKLQFPANTAYAIALATRLGDLLWPQPQDVTDQDGDAPTGDGVGDHPEDTESGGNPDQTKQTEDGQKAGEVDDVEPDENDDVNVGPGESSDDAESDDESDESDGEEVGDGGMGDGEPGDGDDGADGGDVDSDDGAMPGDGESDADDRGGSSDGEQSDATGDADDDSDGGGAGAGGESADELLKEAAQKELDSLGDDATYQQDLHDSTVDVRKAITKAPTAGLPDLGRGSYHDAVGPPMVASQHTRRVVRELQDYVAPGWERHQEGGRINPDDYLRRAPGDMAFFDQWNPGRERDASAEVVVLCDTSGSMSGMQETVAQAMWAIKSSMDSLKIPCTVMTFASECRYVYKRTEPTHRTKYRRLSAMGGTEPTAALDETLILMATSTAKAKLVFIITDGEFNSPAAAVRQIAALRSVSGVVASYVGIGSVAEAYGRNNRYYGCHTHGNVTGPMEIPQIVRQTVQAAISRNVRVF